MSRQNNQRTTDRERKPQDDRRDAASHGLRYDAPSRDQRDTHDRSTRQISMNRNYLNDLYERSSI